MPLSEREQVRVTFIGDSHHTEEISQPKNPKNKGIHIHVPNTEKFSSSRTKGNIRAVKMMYRSLGQHGVIFELGFAQGWAVTSDQDQLGYLLRKKKSAKGTFSASRSSPRELVEKAPTLAAAHLLQGRLVSERVFSRLHDEGETRGKGLVGFGCLCFACGCHW